MAAESRRWPGKYWQYIVPPGAWTVNDSWATNIAPVIGILATAFGVTAAASSVFPGVSLDRFELVNLAAVAIIAAPRSRSASSTPDGRPRTRA